MAVGGVLLLLAAAVPFLMSINQAQAACECNVFGTPTGQSNFDDGSDVELGFKFIPSVNGTISGVRFYKQGSMGGTHVGRLWQSDGTPMANATFTETASGWQSVSFSSPVTVTAGTTYVASVTMNDGRYIATPNYFTSNIVNGPLTAPSGPSSGGNGVFNVTAGTFPSTGSGNNANYWIDVAFFATDPPTVTTVAPANSATNVEPGDTVSAVFDQSMNAASFTSSSFTVKDSNQNVVAGTYSYDAVTKKASFAPTEGYSTNMTYTATLKGGGSGSTVKNAGDIPLASDYTWTFTTSTTNTCPCSLKDLAAPVNAGTFDDTGTSELGVKVKPSTNGYITALRFYKPIISTETTHTGNIWSSTGTKLATVTFSDESDYGWQEARLSSPLRVSEDQLYIISYGTTTSVYVASQGALTGTTFGSGYLKAYADQSSENTATGSTTRNGVFTATAGNYPNNGSTNGSYYWIDAVFSVASSSSSPLEVGVTQPKTDAIGIARNQVITAKFTRPVNAATVTNSTFRLFDNSGAQVSGTGTFDVAKGVASFTPSSQLASGQKYTAKLSGSIADTGGVSLGSEYSWSFTVGSPVSNDPLASPGGPILAITNSGPTSKYYGEILRTEGLNYYDSKLLGDVTASNLANYKTAVLAETTLTQAQADMFSDWVNAGGNLIAMRPDSKLAGLLGLTSAGTTRTNQYMLINTSSGPGQGLVSESIQYKGVADNYTLNGATSLATFYSDASTATSNPAVTTRTVGSNGGTAVAFAYDLAKSIIMQHQGNQPWAGQNRDGNGAVRANDLFYGNMAGNVQPDWVDVNKFHIPQADEQQRLLANIIIESTKDKQPMPRFWYLPGDKKAALVMAGDDHGLGNNDGTEKVLNNFLNNSAKNCSVLDWECDRTSHYVYPSAALTNARATQYVGYNFEIGDHIVSNCDSFVSYAQLDSDYTTALNSWHADKYTTVPRQVSHRYHCYVWSDWDSQARVDVNHGIRYDLNYVAFPGAWFGARAPLMTGSSMNMRLTDTTGALLDVRQGVTNLDDQATTATNVDALLDGALGSSAFYGIFGTHYDMNNSFDKTLIASAKARNVPMISSLQALTWLDGRNNSTFSNFSGSNGQFNFDITAAVGATGLRAMLPTHDAGGTLNALTIGGSNVTYQTQTVKGQEYAVFNAMPGTYTATYTDYVPPTNGGGDSGGNNGDSNGGDSQTGGGHGAGTATKPKVAATQTPSTLLTKERPSESEPTQTTPPENTETPSIDSPKVTPDTSAEDEPRGVDIWGWVFGALGFGLLGLGVWWFILLRRRHQQETGQF